LIEVVAAAKGEALIDEPLVERVVVLSPRGYCAGVERAVETVERALELFGAPLYVRKQVVHNRHVVADLEARGAVFVDSEKDVPLGARIVFAAHGVAPEVRDQAKSRGLQSIDATCPLVSKVHAEVKRFADAGYLVLVVGHAGHDEIVGTMGVAPRQTVLIETLADAEAFQSERPDRLAYVTQTTLSVDDTAVIVDALRRRFPDILEPRKEDICYATTNRQAAVKKALGQIDFLVVVGSENSSNSNRLVETAHSGGVPAVLVDDPSGLEKAMFAGVRCVGLTAGASAPEQLVLDVCDWFKEWGAQVQYSLPDSEGVLFRLPTEVRPLVEAR
jgi:4-hydroxy-3-methylbut-2-en-1-yl diphosphate reductase